MGTSKKYKMVSKLILCFVILVLQVLTVSISAQPINENESVQLSGLSKEMDLISFAEAENENKEFGQHFLPQLKSGMANQPRRAKRGVEGFCCAGVPGRCTRWCYRTSYCCKGVPGRCDRWCYKYSG